MLLPILSHTFSNQNIGVVINFYEMGEGVQII